MDLKNLIGPDPASYADPVAYARDLEHVFARSWHLVGDVRGLAGDSCWLPVTLLPDSLDEPLVFTRIDGQVRAFANVCTHRAALLATEAGNGRLLRCPYHGRCFGLDGTFQAAKGFDGAQPDLEPVASARWGGLLWASAEPSKRFDAVAKLLQPLAFARWASFEYDPDDSRDYVIDAPWALYIENYLEGLHIPFVHPRLSSTLDLTDYRIETHSAGVLQIGMAAPGEPTFNLPLAHRLHGENIAALYAWIFPSTIVNLYPWGASLNLVQPLGPKRTRIRYLTYVGDRSLRGQGAGADVHRTEAEDQAVVQRVAQGIRSRWARPATYAPDYEAGVAWFHRLWLEARGR